MAEPSRAPNSTSQRPPMPHVSTQWQSVDLTQRRSFDARKSLSSQRSPGRTSEIHRSTPSSPRKRPISDARSHPNLHLLATPENTRSEFGPVQHRRNNSSDVYSASSPGDSVFELPSAQLVESPNSSIHTSFVAELEDTSSMGFTPSPTTVSIHTKAAAPTNVSMLFKSNKITSRAIIKVVDETIAAIEASNRELLCRAEAAEATAYKLQVANSELQVRLDECTQNYHSKISHLQKSAATQTTPRHTPHTSIDANGSPTLLSNLNTPLSNFNAGMDTHAEPKRKKSLRNLKFIQRHHAEAFSQPLSPPSHDLKQRRASSDRPQTADGITSPNYPPPPVPELPNNVTSPLLHTRRHTRTISLEEARKVAAAKPLPPLGPMSPSVVQGVVEIGLGIQDGEGRESDAKTLRSQRSRVRFMSGDFIIKDLIEEKKKEKRKISDLFKWGKKAQEKV